MILFLLLFAEGSDPYSGDGIKGVWIYKGYRDSVAELARAPGLYKKEPGIWFKKDGTLVRRQNASWCGTPPISYENYPGTWRQLTDSTLVIRHEFWGGTQEQEWWIVASSSRKLKVKIMRTEYLNERPGSE